MSSAARGVSMMVSTATSLVGMIWRTLIAPIGFREVLLLGGTAMLGLGAAMVYPPALYLAPGVVLVGVAVFGVRA